MLTTVLVNKGRRLSTGRDGPGTGQNGTPAPQATAPVFLRRPREAVSMHGAAAVGRVNANRPSSRPKIGFSVNRMVSPVNQTSCFFAETGQTTVPLTLTVGTI